MNTYTRQVQAFAREQSAMGGRGLVVVYQDYEQIVALDFLSPQQVWDAFWSPDELVAAVKTYDSATEFVAVALERRHWPDSLPSFAHELTAPHCLVVWSHRAYVTEE